MSVEIVICQDTMTKTAYDLSRQPFAAEEVEEESRRKVESEMSREERIAKLRGITEKMLSHKSDYALTARALAAAAYKVSFKIISNEQNLLISV